MNARDLLAPVVTLLLLQAAVGVRAQDSLLTLDKAITLALEKNYDVRIAGNVRDQAANNSNAGMAGMLPRLDLNGAYSKTVGSAKQHLSSGQDVDRDNSVSDNTTANATVTWTVFDGLRMFATREKLEQLAAQGEQSLKVQLETTTTEVITSYYAVVQQQQLLRALETQLAVADELVTINDRKLNNGLGSRMDLLTASTDRNSLRSQQLSAQASLDRARVGLCDLLALPANTSFSVEDTVLISYDPSLEELQKQAGSQNSLLLLYDRQQRIAELGLKEYKAGRLPTIALNGAYQYTRSTNNASFLLLNQTNGYLYGVTATLPLFNGFKLDTQIKNARIDVMNAQLAYERTQEQVSTDVLGAYQDFQAAKEILKLEEENIVAVGDMLAIARERYRVGTSTIIEMKDALATYGDAEQRLAAARNAAKLAETQLRRLAGVLVR